MRRVGFVSGVLVASAALVSSSASGGTAAASAVRIVDRTLACTTGVQGGARVIYVRAQSAFGGQGKNLEWLAQTTVAAVGQPVPSKPNYRPTLAGMTAGWPAPPPLTSGGVGFSSRLCKTTRSKVAFVRSGLVGGVASQLGDEFSCVVPKSMLVRVRAVFRERDGAGARSLLHVRQRPHRARPDRGNHACRQAARLRRGCRVRNRSALHSEGLRVRNVATGAIVAMLACAALVGGSTARAEPEAPRVLDRTFTLRHLSARRPVHHRRSSAFRHPSARKVGEAPIRGLSLGELRRSLRKHARVGDVRHTDGDDDRRPGLRGIRREDVRDDWRSARRMPCHRDSDPAHV